MRFSQRPPAGRIAYVDGRYLPHGRARVHVEDRGLQLADSVYEVCALGDGTLLDETAHMDRLERSLGAIEMAMPMGRAALALVMREVVRRNRVDDGLLYLQVTRGAMRRDHPIPSPQPRPTLILTVHPANRDAAARRMAQGVGVLTRLDERWARCDIKTTQLLPNLLAKTAARRAGAYEAWLIDKDGFITEGGSSNAWIVDEQGHVVTRDLSHAILPGVTRAAILRAAADAQIPIIERKFTPAEAQTAHEAFITSATEAAVPVIAIDGKPVGDGKPGPLTRRLHELYEHRAGAKIAD